MLKIIQPDERIKEYLNKWRGILYSWIGRLNTVQMSVLPRLIYRFNSIPIKILARFYVDTDKVIIKLT